MVAGGFRAEGARNGNVSSPRMFHMLAEQEAGLSTPSDPLLQRGYLSEPSLSKTKTRTRPSPFHTDLPLTDICALPSYQGQQFPQLSWCRCAPGTTLSPWVSFITLLLSYKVSILSTFYTG